VSSQSGDDVAREEASELEPAAMTIADIVVDQANNEGEFIELLNAVLAADASVLEKLSGPGSFTVFAPTDEAFEALYRTDALDNVGSEELTSILLYHMVEGELDASQVLSTSFLRMFDRSIAEIDGRLGKIGDAEIIATDIEADNGIIHVIDAVLLPPAR
jgi:uncharacterized surface protein with fasciclin (FAS1) repeats